MRSKLAVWRPVAYKNLAKRTGNKAVVLHTNGAPAAALGSLFAYWSSVAASGSTKGAHFQIASSGHVEQYADTDLVLGHAWDANDFAVGIETEDGGDPSQPWTVAQVGAITAICKELGVPGQALKVWPSDGLGYHQEYPSWNQSGHNCPGPTRVMQIAGIIAALAGGGDDLTDAQAAQLTHVENFAKGVAQALGIDESAKGGYFDTGQALGAKLASVETKVDALVAKP